MTFKTFISLFFLLSTNEIFAQGLNSSSTFDTWKIAFFTLCLIILISLLILYRISKKKKNIKEEKVNMAYEHIERLSIVASETENIIIIMDAQGNLEWLNDAFIKLNEITLDELIKKKGKNIRDISNNPRINSIIDEAILTKKSVRYESENKLDDGSSVWEDSTMTPIYDDENVLKKLIIIDSDITDVKIAQEESKQKNQEILDSINYAKRIQSTILPSKELISQLLPKSFVYYRPKSIVAGDFYWMDKVDDCIIFAVADCTGHGVPGAMVSVVCHNALNRATREFGFSNPAEILDKTREIIIEEFSRSNEDVKDGMDIALCAFNPKEMTLNYAGANNPLCLIRKNELTEYQADKEPIGKYHHLTNFKNHQIKIEKDDLIYIYTDGYIDQFGGDKGKKFKSKNFKNLLLRINEQSIENQFKEIDNHFKDWMGNLEQLDDVCIMGVKF